ncbi:ricin-type beta-trefoil lectin domain protein [Streptomyces lushanensis]|uniref:ricin-type beta-trefoil lectin domain protein n=1 Tax=Streptomyces lushanensis TaxID=1434255 RepID=UPI00082F9236|nr:ricin-type beta-trefoil lectin domain protein [Streptomyces lushanensis]
MRRRRAAARRSVIAAVFLALLVGALPSAYAVPPPNDDRTEVELVDLPDAEAQPEEDDPDKAGELEQLTTALVKDPVEYEPAATAAPVGGTATETLSGLTPGDLVPVVGEDGQELPVELGAPEGVTTGEAAALEGEWQVTLADQDDIATSSGAEVEGMALMVTPPADATGEAVVALNYTDFAELYGANWADRLDFVQFPACFLTTPDTEGCSEPTTVDTENVVETAAEGGERRILATLDVADLASGETATAETAAAEGKGKGTIDDILYRESPAAGPATAVQTALTAAAGSGASVLLATDSGSGSKGDFSATPLASAGSWSAGGNSGAFTYTYNLQVPGVPGGPSPAIGFGYNSQGVDGRTSATNTQPSWIGDGWDYNPGSITRSYRACRDDTTDGNNTNRKTSDLCWGSYNAVLTLGGTTTELVLPDKADAVGDNWVTSSGDGSRVELLKNTDLANGDADGEYWRVTTRDGTQYYFGRNKLPGWESGDATTASVLSAPVAGNQSEEPCHATKFEDSFCGQAWRWNLDYVVDPQGHAMSLWWGRENNYYAKNMKFADPVLYHRGGYLRAIKYGQEEGSLFDAEPLARVDFAVDERCFGEGVCTEANFTSGDFDKNRVWYDTPADLYCSGAAGKDCFVPVPTFWSRKRLTQVTTQAQRTRGSTAQTPVDSWTLQQSLPADLTDEGAALWLESITRTGYEPDGETTKTLNPVRFVANSLSMPNRVQEGADDSNPVFDRLRIARVVSEYGGETLVKYKAPTGSCKTGSGFPKPEDNTGLCFPVYWHPDPDKSEEAIDWFNKYVVESVQEKPAVTGVPDVDTSYDYDDEGGGAWALNQAEFSKKKTRTYDQWRGFSLVKTVTGENSATPYTSTRQSLSATRYFRGMNGDLLPDGSTRSVTVEDSAGQAVAKDEEAFQGRVAETLTYTENGGELLTRSVDRPTATLLASRTRGDGIPPLEAFRVQDAESVSVTRASNSPSGNPTWRTTKTVTEYEDDYGLPVQVESQGDTADPDDQSCTVMSYVHNTAKHLIGLDKQTLTTAGTCAQAASATAEDWIEGSRVAYDDGEFADTPEVGQATKTWDVSGTGGGWSVSGTMTYDDYGRVKTADDAVGTTDTTTYLPDSGQVYSIVTTNELGHTATTEVEPGRGTSLKETDANGRTTEYAYDALGRTTATWGAATGTTATAPAVKVAYNTTIGQPVSVVTSALTNEDTYADSVVIYDGLGRERQKQEPAVGDGRLITDVLYTRNGTIAQTNNAYYATGEPSTIPFELDSDSQVPNATLYAYDGLGRVLTETPYEAGVAKPQKASRNEYGYDNSTVIEPEGAAAQRSYSDALGRTVRVDTFTDAARKTFRSTEYTYDTRGDMVLAEDSEGNQWTWTYDARGRQTVATDPDTGTTKTTYDVADRPVTVENGRGVTVWNKYDELSRVVEQHKDDAAGELLTTTRYDKLPGGLGLPTESTRYTDNQGYTTSVTGYTADYQPTGKTVTLPTPLATEYGLEKSYTYSYAYSRAGLLTSVTLPKVGTLDSEKLVVRYNEDGLPVSTSGDDWYAAETTYSPYGEVLRTTSGEQPNRVWTTNLFDESSGELQQSIVDRESISDTTTVPDHRVNARSYAYDPAGNVTSIADRVNGVTDRQCFTYDALGQLSEAWTAPSACTAPGKTVAAPKYPDGTANVTAAADGYWQSYEYDALGNREKLVEHDPGLVDGKDATTTYAYGAEDGTQPHTLTGMSTTYTADSGARVTKAAELTYNAAGDTETRTWDGDEQALEWTWDGQVAQVTGFGENGAGAWIGLAGKCLDLSSSSTAAGTALQLWECNGTKAQQLRIDRSSSGSSGDPATGALKVLGKCAMPKGGGTAVGTAVVIADCTGAANQQWTATSGGVLKHKSSDKCLDVPGSNSANGTDLQLYTCNSAGSQTWNPDERTKYVYDASGQRLMAIGANERTLYLGDATLTMNADKSQASVERYYAQPGAPTVMRHATGNGAAAQSVQIADQNGTAYINVALAEGNRVQFSKTDPFGNERAESGGWRSDRSYVGGDDDSGGGLVHLGAREYDPVTGRFLSVDPVLDLADPVQMNGYVYCENNPVTFADPSGLASESAGGGGGGGPSAGDEAWAKRQLNTSLSDIILSVGWAALKEFVGWNDVVGCFSRGDLWACGSLFVQAIPWTKVFKIPSILKAAARIAGAVNAWMKAKEKARKIIELARKARELAQKAKEAKKRAAALAAQIKKKAQQAATRQAKKAAQKTGNAVQKTKKAAAAKPAAKPQAGKQSPGGGAGCSEEKNSFTPGTMVLMADGTTKPIEDVENGDKVLATDPETGETAVETVTAEISGEGVKHLVKVSVDTDGAQGDRTATVTATEGHPFWVPELHEWIDATALKPGQWLRTSAGTYVQITALERWTTQKATVHNLTVSDLHTYYVVAGATSVLVHNCGTGPRDGAGLGPDELMSKAEGLRDEYAGEMAQLSNRKRPATVTAGYNSETGQYAAGASSKGVCAETCVVNQLGGDPSKIVFTTAVRPRTGAPINICVSCEGQFGRSGFKGAGTVFDSDVLRLFDE